MTWLQLQQPQLSKVLKLPQKTPFCLPCCLLCLELHPRTRPSNPLLRPSFSMKPLAQPLVVPVSYCLQLSHSAVQLHGHQAGEVCQVRRQWGTSDTSMPIHIISIHPSQSWASTKPSHPLPEALRSRREGDPWSLCPVGGSQLHSPKSASGYPDNQPSYLPARAGKN